VFASACLTEEGVEGIISSSDGLITGHLPIWLDAMLKAEELPASIANLDASLANVDAKCLTHLGNEFFSNKLLLCEEVAT